MTQLVFIAHIALFLVLSFHLALWRSFLVLAHKRSADGFHPQGEDHTPYYHRLTRVRANLIENIPLWGGLLGLALMTQKTSITDPYALWFLLARLGQTTTHLVSVHPLAINIRFVFFMIQLGLASYWTAVFYHSL